MPQNRSNNIKDEKTYQALRDDGSSKEKAARIANAKANKHQHPSKKGGSQPPYEEWTKQELYDRAKEIGIDGRSGMSKSELMNALRNH